MSLGNRQDFVPQWQFLFFNPDKRENGFVVFSSIIFLFVILGKIASLYHTINILKENHDDFNIQQFYYLILLHTTIPIPIYLFKSTREKQYQHQYSSVYFTSH